MSVAIAGRELYLDLLPIAERYSSAAEQQYILALLNRFAQSRKNNKLASGVMRIDITARGSANMSHTSG
jgi:hypothetical protein